MARPFYLVGHNTNSIDEIREGLAKGINAFEIDIQKDPDNQLYVAHDPVLPQFLVSRGFPVPPRVVPFLTELKQLFDASGDRPALVIFDCKIDDPELASVLLADVRSHLTDNGATLPVIISVAKLEMAERFFPPIRGRLTAREGLMIDQESSPGTAAAHFSKPSVVNACYGDGITTVFGIGAPFGPSLANRMDVATAYVAVANLRFIMPWVVVQSSTIEEMLRIGVNAIMVDVGNAAALTSAVANFAQEVRPATRGDDPFAQVSWLLLEVTTKDVHGAGTDANITFTVEHIDGRTVSRTVDGGYSDRFERGRITCVTFPGVSWKLPDVKAVTVLHDGSGAGPTWTLHSIKVRDRAAEKVVLFDIEVPSNTAVRRAT